MWPDLYLMRHGETLWNTQNRMQGGLDSPLTDRGRQQAARQGALVAEVAGARFSSPLGRAVATAQIVFPGRDFHVDARLAEIGMGVFARHRLDHLRQRHPELFTGPPLQFYDRIPGGEGFAALGARCRAFLEGLSGPSLIVTHGITLRMLRLLAMGQDVDAIARAELWQGAVHVVRNGIEEVWR